MRIGRAILIPTILALGVVGSALSGSAMPTAVGHAVSTHVLAATASVTPDIWYHA